MTGLQQMEHNIARCRLVLSVAALLVVYIDPEAPLLAQWIPWVSGHFTMDPRLLAVMVAHLTYSLAIYFGLSRRLFSPRAMSLTPWADVLFGLAIMTMTEGVTGPGYPFFAFAVGSSGLRGGLRPALLVTTVSLGLYTGLILVSVHGTADVYIMRPVYLAITGYLLGYLGQQRLDLEAHTRQLEVAEQRHRIARDLHDGYAQALAGITLRLEGARRALRANAADEALGDLTELQESVKREYDDLRSYARALAGVADTPSPGEVLCATRLALHVDLSGSLEVIDHILGIARQGISNVRRHARATTARIDIQENASGIVVDISDDGIGFDEQVAPWSIASRVREIGGNVRLVPSAGPGAHLLITLPQT